MKSLLFTNKDIPSIAIMSPFFLLKFYNILHHISVYFMDMYLFACISNIYFKDFGHVKLKIKIYRYFYKILK